MIIMEIPSCLRSIVLKTVRSRVMENLYKVKETKAVKELLNQYNKNEIEDSLMDIYIDGNYICMDSRNKILRLMEYGGPKIKALNLISKTCREFIGGRTL